MRWKVWRQAAGASKGNMPSNTSISPNAISNVFNVKSTLVRSTDVQSAAFSQR